MPDVTRSALDAVESCLLTECREGLGNAVAHGLALHYSVYVVAVCGLGILGVAVCSEVAVEYDTLLQVGGIVGKQGCNGVVYVVPHLLVLGFCYAIVQLAGRKYRSVV